MSPKRFYSPPPCRDSVWFRHGRQGRHRLNPRQRKLPVGPFFFVAWGSAPRRICAKASRAAFRACSTATATFSNCILWAAQVPGTLCRDPTRHSAECSCHPRQNLFHLVLELLALNLNLSLTLASFALSKMAVNVGSGGRQSLEVLSHRLYTADCRPPGRREQHARATTNLIFPRTGHLG